MKLNGKLFKEIAGLLKTTAGTANGTLKTLQYALVTTHQDSIHFESTNLNNGIRITIPKEESIEIDTDISFIPIADMQTFATKSKSSDNIEIRDNSLINGKVTKQFKELVSEDNYPAIDYLSQGIDRENAIPFNFFAETIDYISSFAAKDDYRETLNGIAFVPEQKELVATNGNVLACRKNVPFDFNSITETFIVNPEISKVLKKVKSTVKNDIVWIEIKGTDIVFTFTTENFTMSIWSRLVKGGYPPYHKVYPDSHNYIAEYRLNCNDIQKVNNFFDGEETNQVNIHVKDDNTVIFSENKIDYETTIEGKIESEMEVPDHTFGVNYKFAAMFIRKGMTHLPIAFVNPNTAITIEDDEYKNLLMPVKLFS